jgi:hypothetical protein
MRPPGTQLTTRRPGIDHVQHAGGRFAMPACLAKRVLALSSVRR